MIASYLKDWNYYEASVYLFYYMVLKYFIDQLCIRLTALDNIFKNSMQVVLI